MKIRQLIEQCWLFDFRLLWCADEESLTRYVRERIGVEGWVLDRSLLGGAYLEIVDGDYTVHLVVLPYEWDDSNEHIVALGHECNHAALCILRERNVPISVANDETLCYLQSRLARWSLAQVRPAGVNDPRRLLKADSSSSA